MIVCMCNGLKDSVCRTTAADGRCRGVGCIYRLNGARVRCGRCLPMMRTIFAAYAPEGLQAERRARAGTDEMVRARA